MPKIGELCRVEMRLIHDSMLYIIEEAITRGLADGSIRELPVRESAILALGMIIGTVRLRVFHPEIHLHNIESVLLEFLRRATYAR